MKKRNVLGLMGLAGVALALPAFAQSAQKQMHLTVQTKVNYLQFIPKSYSAKGAGVPLIVFLHGSGERGDDLEKVKAWGPPAIADKNPDFPFMVLSPQVPNGEWWSAASVKAAIDEVLSKYNVDRDRIYLTGLSMGGYGAWDVAIRYPGLFAAVAPICGGGNTRMVGQMRTIPTWVFHGKKDEAVPERESAMMVEALQSVGGNVKYTVLPDGGHVDAWVYAYEKAGLFDWFLTQKKK